MPLHASQLQVDMLRASLEDARDLLRLRVAPSITTPFAASSKNCMTSHVAMGALLADIGALERTLDTIEGSMVGPAVPSSSEAPLISRRVLPSPDPILKSIDRSTAAIHTTTSRAQSSHDTLLKDSASSNFSNFVNHIDDVTKSHVAASVGKIRLGSVGDLSEHTSRLSGHCDILRTQLTRKEDEMKHVSGTIERLLADMNVLERAHSEVDGWGEDHIHSLETSLQPAPASVSSACEDLSYEITMLRNKLCKRNELASSLQLAADAHVQSVAIELKKFENQQRLKRRVASVAHMYPVHPLGIGENGSCAPLCKVVGNEAVLSQYVSALDDFGRQSKTTPSGQCVTSYLVLRHGKEHFISPLSSDAAATPEYVIGRGKVTKHYDLKCPSGVTVRVDSRIAATVQ